MKKLGLLKIHPHALTTNALYSKRRMMNGIAHAHKKLRRAIY